MIKHGIFIKVFTYTVIAVLLLVSVMAVLFSGQFMLFYRTLQNRQIVASYQPLVKRIQTGNTNDIASMGQRFHENNQSFVFLVVDNKGDPIYATPNANTSDNFRGDFFFVVHKDTDFSVIAQNRTGLESLYRDLAIRVFAVFAVMLALSLFCAYVFAKQITKPIRQLVNSAGRMANLEEVPPPAERKDELGVLAHDIYFMYEKLKETISQLENEILRVRELEETQRYFFSAASHELKTPIAATSVLLEGMLENIGDYKDRPKYLRECVRMMDVQGKTISEILEIVSLNNGKIAPVPEKLNIGDTVLGMLPDYQLISEANDLRIITDIPAGINCLIDPKMFQKAISNIILNAVQNTPKGGEVRIWGEQAAEQFRLCVMNTGARIDDGVLPKLFDPFYRVDKARSREIGRSGLGLAIVRKTLEAMSINFALENTPDGVLFWMDLPKA
ncbi:MAG: HAMP domain-containing histidine kinase [Lacrimispora celerecrescens]|nr:HAMP domain-containing histidine kinase [Lacrimispora celerecrescens]